MTSVTSAVPLPDRARELFDAPEFATVATVEPDGQPHLSIVWVARDGDDVLFSTVRGRRKTVNLERDPRATVLISPAGAPYSYVEVRGTVALIDDPDSSLIHTLARKYTGAERYTADDGTGNERVIVRLTPTKVVVRG